METRRRHPHRLERLLTIRSICSLQSYSTSYPFSSDQAVKKMVPITQCIKKSKVHSQFSLSLGSSECSWVLQSLSYPNIRTRFIKRCTCSWEVDLCRMDLFSFLSLSALLTKLIKLASTQTCFLNRHLVQSKESK